MLNRYVTCILILVLVSCMCQSAQMPCCISNLYIQVTVLRDGGVKDISMFDLLVGDVMLFETGDIVPADGVIITGNTIR